MREVDLVWGEVLRPEFVVRAEMELPFTPPAKEYPCAAVRQISLFNEKSASFPEDGVVVTLQDSSPADTALGLTSLPPDKRDNKKDNMSTIDFTKQI